MGEELIFWTCGLYVAQSSSGIDTDLDELLQLLSDLRHQPRTTNPSWLLLVIHGSDLGSSSINPFI